MSASEQAGDPGETSGGTDGQKFEPGDWGYIEKASSGLANEITMLRITIRRLYQIAAQEANLTVDIWLRTLSTMVQATARLADLLKTQKAIAGDEEDEMRQALVQVLKEMNDEWRETPEG
jgi:hypothetical protein